MKDWFECRKAEDPNFSYRAFAQRSGIASHAQVHKVIHADRKIPASEAGLYARGLKLHGPDEIYFLRLVNSDNDAVPDVQETDDSRLSACKVLICGMVGLTEFRNDPQWISATTQGILSFYEAKICVEELIRDGVLKQNDQGAWETGEVVFTNKKGAPISQKEFFKINQQINEANGPGKSQGTMNVLYCDRVQAHSLMRTIRGEVTEFGAKNRDASQAYVFFATINKLTP